MNISLIGYRGTGKSTIALILAEKTGFALTNLDAMIVEKASMPVPEIVKKFGWDRFRDIESEVLEEAAKADNQILDCGGGIILRQDNREKLKELGPVFWLVADIPSVIERIKEDTQRPSLTGKSFVDEVSDVLKEREPLYRDCADHIIDTVALSPEDSTNEILRLADPSI